MHLDKIVLSPLHCALIRFMLSFPTTARFGTLLIPGSFGGIFYDISKFGPVAPDLFDNVFNDVIGSSVCRNHRNFNIIISQIFEKCN